MNDLPNELWNTIFATACLDDGSTGRSLSAVTKTVREATAGVKLGSVALTGETQVTKFRNLLLRTETCRRKIQHLFLCVENAHGHSPWTESRQEIRELEGELFLTPCDDQHGPGSKEDIRRRLRALSAPLADRKAVVTDSVASIMLASAPTVEHMTILSRNLDLTAFHAHFKRLVELTVQYDAFVRRDPATSKLVYVQTQPDLTLPTVRHLHLINDSHEGFSRVFSLVNSWFPSLLHLRLSGVGISDLVPAALRIYLDVPIDDVDHDRSLTMKEKDRLRGGIYWAGYLRLDPDSHLEALALHNLMVVLKRIFLQKVPNRISKAWEAQGTISAVLQWLVTRDKQARLVVINPHEHSTPVQLAKEIWLGETAGRERWWDEVVMESSQPRPRHP
ncbi:hypothetical protein PUNSTDRAFT_132106 [Punctularia strigosozonata HHB-11173 SS5]|uniref:uncharacterized protein n=1 Tax=Punctularia strigosozonata (strain HHB-11173) TaxID=741275 RepID=UPI0004416E6D|nr:uncharacterized protein PUNSTDRAFT_132106 [Punctularia strigosozonata HHB-11173 SS5]EIN11963.1 hypothetical protein PUNSTDRAFT_132106 [Punctularia strigosozonata HHB-11173 SS5]